MNSICHVTSVHSSTDDRILYKECFSLAKKYKVSLIAPNTEDRIEHGVSIFNVSLPQGRFRRQRCLDRVFEKMVIIDADVYHFHDPELMRLGIKIKKRGKKVIFDSHEDVPMQILCKEYLPTLTKKPLSWIYSRYEKSLLSKYDGLISVTPTIVDRLKQINPNTYMVTNFPVLAEYKVGYHKRELNGDKSGIFCFAGGVCQQYMHDNIIKALLNTSGNYLLAGPAYPGYVESLQKLEAWNKVEYLGIVDHKRVYDMYDKATAGIVLIDYTPNVGYHKGTLGVVKLFEMMMAGIPVIATDFELWKDVVEGNDCGICVDPYDIDAIADAMNYLINNPQRAYEMGKNGRKAVEEKYNWLVQEKELFKVYDSLIS